MPEKIILVTGERYAGKTTKLKSLIHEYRARDITAAGIISVNPEGGPGGFPDKGRYFALNVESGESRLLAAEDPIPGAEYIRFKRFYFSKETFLWAASVIEKGFLAPALFIDEIGELEHQGEGFRDITEKALQVYRGALIISLRKRFLSEFIKKIGTRSDKIQVMEAVC